jgi:hypothetical protein
MIETIIQVGLEIYKNKDSINSVFNPKYLSYDLNKLTSYYINNKLVDKRIPYIELYDFVENPDVNVVFSKNDNEFRIENGNIIEIKTFQTNALEEFKQKGKFTFDSNTVRLNDFIIKENEVHLEIMKSKYSDQVQSHLVLDWENKHLKKIGNMSLRGFLLAKYGNTIPPLTTNYLSNSIGISVIIYYMKNNQLTPYLPFRNKSIFSKKKNEPALYEGTYHCSSSGALEWKDGLYSIDSIKNEMFREIYEEIGLEKKEIITLEHISITRELLRAGKPQIFFIGFTKLNENKLIERRKQAINTSKNNADKIEIKDKHLIFEGERLKSKRTMLSLEAIGNLYYCEKYLDKNGREQYT